MKQSVLRKGINPRLVASRPLSACSRRVDVLAKSTQGQQVASTQVVQKLGRRTSDGVDCQARLRSSANVFSMLTLGREVKRGGLSFHRRSGSVE